MIKFLFAIVAGLTLGGLTAELLRPTESRRDTPAISEKGTIDASREAAARDLSLSKPPNPLRRLDAMESSARTPDGLPLMSGQVLDSEGKPLPGVLIRLAPHSELQSQDAAALARSAALRTLRNSPSTRTDANGRYEFNPFDPQSLTLNATLAGYEIVPLHASLTVRNRRDFIAHPKHPVRVRILGLDESRIRRVLLRWRLTDHGPPGEAMTRKPLPPTVQDWTPASPEIALRAGTYNVDAALMDASGASISGGVAWITITSQHEEQVVDMTLRETRRLSGHIALPLIQRNYSVRLFMTLYRGDPSLVSDPSLGIAHFQDIDGYEDHRDHFAFNDLLPDVYTLDLSLVKGRDRTSLSRRAVDLRAGSRQVALSVDLPPDRLEIHCQDPDGKPLPGAKLRLSSGDGIRNTPYQLATLDGSLHSTQVLSYWKAPPDHREPYREIGLKGNHPEHGFVDVMIPVPPSGSMVLRWPKKQSLRVHVPGIHRLARDARVEIFIASRKDSNFVRIMNSQFDAQDQATIEAPDASAFLVSFGIRHRDPRLHIDFAAKEIALDSGADLLRVDFPPHGTLVITSPPAAQKRIFEIRRGSLPSREGEELSPVFADSFVVEPSATPKTITIGPIPSGAYSLEARLEASKRSEGRLQFDLQGTKRISWEPQFPDALIVRVHDPEGLYAHAGLQSKDSILAIDGVRIGEAFTAEAALARLQNPTGMRELRVRRDRITLEVPIDGDAIANDPDLGGADFNIPSVP